MGLVTLEDVKERLGIAPSDLTSDKFLQSQIDYYSAVIETYCERSFERATVTETWEKLKDTGQVFTETVFWVRHYPIITINSVSVNDALVTEYQQVQSDRIFYSYFRGADKIEINFDGGYDPIPAEVSMVCEELVASKQGKQTAGMDPTQIVRSESVPEVGTVNYIASIYQNGMHPILGIYEEILDPYRTERHFGFEANTRVG
jgi:hypothetical protein